MFWEPTEPRGWEHRAAPSQAGELGCSKYHALSTLLGCRAVILGWGGSTAVGCTSPGPLSVLQDSAGTGIRRSRAWPEAGTAPGAAQRAHRTFPFPACHASHQHCAACARRHNSLPSGRSALPRPDKVPQPKPGWAPVWVCSPLGHRVKAGTSAPSHGHCTAVPGRAGALGQRRMAMPCRDPAPAGREGRWGAWGTQTLPASPCPACMLSAAQLTCTGEKRWSWEPPWPVPPVLALQPQNASLSTRCASPMR